MTTAKISASTSLVELAAIVGTALKDAGIEAVLMGGGALAVHSSETYLSYDLDFAANRSAEELEKALSPLGFKRKGKERYFIHPDTEFLVEFPARDIWVGETYIDFSQTSILSTPSGDFRIITPTQSIMDRLAAFVHWGDKGSYEQALMVIQSAQINWSELYEWAKTEGVDGAIIDELREAKDAKSGRISEPS